METYVFDSGSSTVEKFPGRLEAGKLIVTGDEETAYRVLTKASDTARGGSERSSLLSLASAIIRTRKNGSLRTPTSVEDARSAIRKAKKHRDRALEARKEAVESGYELGVRQQDEIVAGYDAAIVHFEKWLSENGPKKKADENGMIPWTALAELERERLARKVVKLRGAYVNLHEIVEVMQSAPEKSGNDLIFAADLLSDVSREVDAYLSDLNALLGIRGLKRRRSSAAFVAASVRVAARFAGDPRWMSARYPGVDTSGRPFVRGQQVLYWPTTKTFMTGDEARKAWNQFQSEKGDDEGTPY